MNYGRERATIDIAILYILLCVSVIISGLMTDKDTASTTTTVTLYATTLIGIVIAYTTAYITVRIQGNHVIDFIIICFLAVTFYGLLANLMAMTTELNNSIQQLMANTVFLDKFPYGVIIAYGGVGLCYVLLLRGTIQSLNT